MTSKRLVVWVAGLGLVAIAIFGYLDMLVVQRPDDLSVAIRIAGSAATMILLWGLTAYLLREPRQRGRRARD